MGKKYQCEECGYQGTHKSTLNTHQQAVHMGKKYLYEKCDYQNKWKHNLIIHQQSVHVGTEAVVKRYELKTANCVKYYKYRSFKFIK